MGLTIFILLHILPSTVFLSQTAECWGVLSPVYSCAPSQKGVPPSWSLHADPTLTIWILKVAYKSINRVMMQNISSSYTYLLCTLCFLQLDSIINLKETILTITWEGLQLQPINDKYFPTLKSMKWHMRMSELTNSN